MSANCVVVLTGKKGTGKTTKLRALIAPARRLLVADPEGAFEPRPGDEVLEGPAALLSRVNQALDPAVPFRWIYRDTDPARIPLVACGAAFVLRNCTFVADELIWFCNAHRLPDYLNKLLALGRPRRINLLGTTREPQEIHDRWFSTADVRYFFRVEEGNGLDRIRRRYRVLAAALPALAPFACRVHGDETALRLIGREGLALPRARRTLGKRP